MAEAGVAGTMGQIFPVFSSKNYAQPTNKQKHSTGIPTMARAGIHGRTCVCCWANRAKLDRSYRVWHIRNNKMNTLLSLILNRDTAQAYRQWHERAFMAELLCRWTCRAALDRSYRVWHMRNSGETSPEGIRQTRRQARIRIRALVRTLFGPLLNQLRQDLARAYRQWYSGMLDGGHLSPADQPLTTGAPTSAEWH